MRPTLPYSLLALFVAGTAQAANRVELDQVLIQDRQQSELEAAADQLREIPGASNLVDMDKVGQGRVASNQDVLAYQPGVFAQSAGNDGIKLSIRGSGINRAPGAHGSGVYTMFDGLPLTGPGGTPYELFEALWLSRAEVLRGANGFDQGSLALGGAINYVTHTGHDAAPLQVRYEVGSRGYQRRHISTGQVLGNLDYYVALTDAEYDGYQDHSSGSAKGIAANVGYRFNPNLETRFYLRYRETENDLAGRLTKDQIKHHPRAANPAYLARDDRRPQPGSTWVGNKTTFFLDDDSRLEAGLVYHDYPMDLREGPMRLKVAYTDVSGTLNYLRRDTLFGHESKTTLGWRTTKHLPNSGASQFARPGGDNFGARTRDFSYQGSDTVLHAGNDLELIPDLWLTTGLAMIYTRRESDVTYPTSGGKVSQHDWDYAPRLGLRYDLRPDLQVYGNLSRSVEPPHPWSLVWSAPVANQPMKMQNQTAATLELGARGDSALGRWDLAWYYAQVRHELLNVEVVQGLPFKEFNASPTVHQGIEAGLDSLLWEQPGTGKLSLRQAYTFSDFHYRDDDTFGDNRLPGIPMHYYQAELRYDWPSGFHAGVNTQMASKVQVDYANSYHADAYALLGARLGWDSPKRDWQTWLDLRNLTNKRYAATVTPGYNDAGQDIARSTPGEGFGVYAGVSYSFR
ncbi:TonB-dependent receptor [Pseudomonas mosselii]|uniref:TonB-dependent receptor n=1 Tax=Pseudomonas mosselii TaxID=78327 RepID=A0ABX9B5H4_9PSED|nr:TonB-dependent receptor [Pseudomonas mosselii]MDH0630539.1 TonB-dependent receptor [Pseudomonas mosselii]MDH0679023.1 TonB-dependent receptor [Pseudomonas mosselii]MDH0926509.1 TonB-dependent receptor [Pseudomonas mosselii]MDH1134503.1 TonB-dependent receptor [Pseudomonas mosselii]MDH1141490.1 TonB-dependent receptor [Pseudomonas mosselii]